MATNIEELNKWCDEARKMLGNRGKLRSDSSESVEMKRHSDLVMSLLKKMEGFEGTAEVYKTSLAAYAKIAKRAQSATGLTGSVNKEARADELHKATTDLAGLAKTLQTEADKSKVDLENHRLLTVARQAYEADYGKVKEALEQLKVTLKSSPTMAERDLGKIEEAVRQKSVSGYEVGRRELVPVAKEIKTQMTLAEELRKKELVQWGKKPDAQSKFDTAERTYAELTKLPGIEATLSKYKTALDKARSLAMQDNWTAVLAELAEIDKLPKPKDLLKESEKQVSGLSDVASFQAGKSALEALRQLLPESDMVPLDNDFRDAVDLLLATKPRPKDGVATAAGLLATRLAEVKKAETDLAVLKVALDRLIERLSKEVAPMDMIRAKTEYEQFRGLMRAHQRVLALAAGNKLEGYIDGVLPAAEKAHELWLAGSGDAVKLESDFEQLTKSTCQSVRERVATAKNFVAGNRRENLTGLNDWTQLVADLGKARVEQKELVALDAQYLALESRRKSAAADVANGISVLGLALKQLLATMESVVNDKSKNFDPRARFENEIARIKTTWEAAMLAANDESTLATARGRAIDELDQVSSDIADVDNTEGIEGMVATTVVNKALFDLEAMAPLVEKALGALQAKDNEMAARLTMRYGTVRAAASIDAVEALKNMVLLRAEISSASLALTTRRTTEQKELAEVAGAAMAEIRRARRDSGNAKGFKEAFDALTTEHAELLLLGTSTNLDAIREANAGFVALKTRATRFAPTTPGAGASIDKVMETLTGAVTLFERLGSTFQTHCPKRLATLTQRLAALKTATAAADPDDSMLKIAAFTKAVMETEADAKRVVAVRSEFTELLTVAKASYKVFKARTIAPTYTEALGNRLEAAEALAKQPEKLYEALAQLKEVDAEIDAAALDASKAMVKEGTLLKQQHDLEAAQTEWARAVKVFEGRQVGEARAAVKSRRGDPALIIELERMAGLARQTAKDGDPVKAVAQINLAVERARQIVADPFGPAIGSRNHLPKDTAVYREAVGAFQTALTDVGTVAKKLFPASPAAIGKLEDMLAGVSAKFDANAFEAVIVPLAAEGIEAGQRRGYREAALIKVRTVQSMMAANPQMTSLLGNPMTGSAYSIAYRRLQSSLARLDANISRCCS